MAERLDKQIERLEREERYNKPLPPELEELRWKLMYDIRQELAELYNKLVSDVLTRLEPLQPKTWRPCPQCGTEYMQEETICQMCGHILNKETE